MLLSLSNSLNKKIVINSKLLIFILSTIGIPHLGTRIRLHLLEKILQIYQLPKNALVLDAGCGYGFQSIFLSKKNFAVTSVDNNSKRLVTAARLAKICKIKNRFLKADLTNLPIKNDIFDLCICFEVFEHIVNDNKLMQELSRVLKKHGYFIISVPQKQKNVHGFEEFGHVRSGYTIEEIKKLAKKSSCILVDVFPYGKTRLGEIILTLDFYLARISPLLSSFIFPLFYAGMLVDTCLTPPQKRKPTNFIAVFQKKL